MKLEAKDLEKINKLKVGQSTSIGLKDIKCVLLKMKVEYPCANCVFNDDGGQNSSCLDVFCLPKERQDKKDVKFIQTN